MVQASKRAWCAMGNSTVFEIDHIGGGNEIVESEIEDFCQFLRSQHLDFIKSLRHVFSWHQCEKGVKSRIDHAIVNDMWKCRFNNQVVEYLNLGISNHSLLLLYVEMTSVGGGRPFKIFKYLANHPYFTQNASDIWQNNDTSSMRGICILLK